MEKGCSWNLLMNWFQRDINMNITHFEQNPPTNTKTYDQKQPNTQPSPSLSLLVSWNQKTPREKEWGTPSVPEQTHRDMSTEIPSEDKTVLELTQFHLSLEVRSAIQSLSTQMKCSPEETLEMSLREHFCLPRPQRWIRESWVQGVVVLEGEWNGELNSFRC